jgi:hypothetical protein
VNFILKSKALFYETKSFHEPVLYTIHKMSAEYKNADLNKIAKDAERDLNSDAAKKGHGSDSGTITFPLPFSIPFKTSVY